jgi:DinB family protein
VIAAVNRGYTNYSSTFQKHLFAEAIDGPIRTHGISTIQTVAARGFPNDRLGVRGLLRHVRYFQLARQSGIIQERIWKSERIEMDIVTRLEAARNQTLRFFDLSDEQLDRNYGSGKWSVRFILHHLADAETVLFDRIRRVLSEPRQVLWAFDQDAWATGLDYSRLPLDLSRRIYDAVRVGIIYQARLHYDIDGHREFVHSETGVRTLKAEFDKVASHNEHHLEQIELALKGFGA